MFTIAIDFDGTIIDNNFPFDITIKDKAKETINYYYYLGCYISIWTCRSNWFISDCKRILKENGINFHDVNQGNPIYSHSRKIYADCYIDDKAIPDFDWEKGNSIIEHFYKKSLFSKNEWVNNKEELYDIFFKECKKRCPEEELKYASESIKIMLGIIDQRGK